MRESQQLCAMLAENAGTCWDLYCCHVGLHCECWRCVQCCGLVAARQHLFACVVDVGCKVKQCCGCLRRSSCTKIQRSFLINRKSHAVCGLAPTATSCGLRISRWYFSSNIKASGKPRQSVHPSGPQGWLRISKLSYPPAMHHRATASVQSTGWAED